MFQLIPHGSGFDQNQLTDSNLDVQTLNNGPLSSLKFKRSDFANGDLVTVKKGSFESFQGTITALNAKNRKATVLLSVFGTSTPVEFDYSDIRKA